MLTIPEAPLASCGKAIPLVGFGTAEFPFSSSEETKEAVLHAIEVGYRHFDAASLYQTEQPLGETTVEALRLGIIKSRDELFITSKLWPSSGHQHLVLPALQDALKNLGLEYLDLYLLHYPASLKAGSGFEFPFNKENILALNYESVWGAMEECQKLGLTKSIGLSNFSCKKLEKLLAIAKIPPVANQVDMNPVWQQKKMREFCEEKSIHITAYSPLGGKGTPWGATRVMECEVLKETARSRKMSIAQSYNKERMKENLDIFNWELFVEDILKIEQIPQGQANPAKFFVNREGPFKSIEEFWDGEI